MLMKTPKKSPLFSVKNLFSLAIVILLAIHVGFTAEQSFMRIYQNDNKLNELNKAITQYEMEYKHDTKILHELDSNPAMVERIARERHAMKRPSERVFIYQKEVKQ